MTHRHPNAPQNMPDEPREGFLARFAREYGWRAYAIPVLTVVTGLVIADMVANPDEAVVTTVAEDSTVPARNAGSGSSSGDRAMREMAELPEGNVGMQDLPPGGPFAEQGDGTYREVGSPGAAAGAGDELVLRYVLEVENGVDTSRFGGDDAFAALVEATLAEPRGWTNDKRFGFEHVTAQDNPDLRIQLTSAGTTKEVCGMNLGLETSCRTTLTGESTVVINEARWVRGAAPFEGDVGSYRQYLINHEVGHALGLAAHEPCPGQGELAPVMMQQTISLSNAELHSLDKNEVYPDSPETCRANPWPYPRPAVL